MTRINMRAGKSPAYRQAICDSLYRAMRETFNVPEDDQFMTITEHDGDNFRYGASYLGVARSDDLVLVQLTVSNTRSLEQKKALFSRIAELLVESPRPAARGRVRQPGRGGQGELVHGPRARAIRNLRHADRRNTHSAALRSAPPAPPRIAGPRR